MSKHTAGPWFAREIDLHEGGKGVEVVAGDGEVICDNQTYYPQALDPRNARLIAAAPELLEACQAFLEYHDAEGDDDMEMMLAYAAAVDLARDAIAKALGNQ